MWGCGGCNGDRVCVGGAACGGADVRVRAGGDAMAAAEGRRGDHVRAADDEEGVGGRGEDAARVPRGVRHAAAAAAPGFGCARAGDVYRIGQRGRQRPAQDAPYLRRSFALRVPSLLQTISLLSLFLSSISGTFFQISARLSCVVCRPLSPFSSKILPALTISEDRQNCYLAL